MVKRRRPISALLTNNERPIDAVGLIADILRNIPNLARIGGPAVPLVSPAGGRPMDAATIDFLVFLSSNYLSTLEERKKAKDGTPPPRRPGQRFHVKTWLYHSAMQLKWHQAGLSCKGKDRVNLVNRYLSRLEEDDWRNPQGIDLEALKEWRKSGSFSRGKLWSKDIASLLTSLFIPPGLEALDEKMQRAHLLGLRSQADALFKSYLEDNFPVVFFTFFPRFLATLTRRDS